MEGNGGLVPKEVKGYTQTILGIRENEQPEVQKQYPKSRVNLYLYFIMLG